MEEDRGDERAGARLQPAEGVPGDRFGAVIALADNRALIGAPNWSPAGDTTIVGVGRVYEFRFEDGAWRETAMLDSRIEANANFGFTIAMQGDVAVIGAPGSGDGHGAAFLHRRDPSTGAPSAAANRWT